MPVHALQIQYRFLCSRRPNDADHVFSFLGALLSSRRFPGSSILSCCSYSVVGAYRLIETGEGPLVSFRVPRLCVPNSEPGRLGAPPGASAAAPGGWSRWPIQICSRTDRIRYDCAASSAAFFSRFFSDFRSRRACSACFLCSFFACACSAD